MPARAVAALGCSRDRPGVLLDGCPDGGGKVLAFGAVAQETAG